MMRLIRLLTLSLVVMVTTPSAVFAQEDESMIDAVIEFINKLSGPTMVGPEASYARPVGSVRLRFSTAYLFSVASDDVVEPDGASVTMLSLKPAIEFPMGDCPMSIGAGVSLHRFGGDADEAVWHWSVPVYFQGHFRVAGTEQEPKVFLRVGMGGEYFPEFGADDFAPLTTGVSTDGGELTLIGFAGLAFVVH